jgi:hypothetical protein
MAMLMDGKSDGKLTTDDEHEALVAFLSLLRDNTDWVPDFMRSLKRHADGLAAGEVVNHEHLIGDIITARFNDRMNTRERSGVLINSTRWGDHNEIDEDEFDVLNRLVAIMRNKSWFSDWITLQILSCGSIRGVDDPVPSPLFIAGTLTDLAAEFEKKSRSAKRMLKNHPSLFQPPTPTKAP